MSMFASLGHLPGELLPPGLAAAGDEARRVAEVMFEQRRCENLAYCRTLTAVYALYRAMYADDEAVFLSQPAGYAEVVAARQRLAVQDTALTAQVSTLLRLGPSATDRVVEIAVGMVERLPKVFGLIAEGVISSKAGEVALNRSRVLTDEQAQVFDLQLHLRLTAGDYEVMSLPALREAADLMVQGIDPDAAEKRRRRAEADRTVTFRPDQDGMAAAFVLLTAQEMQALSARLDYIAGTVCKDDPRTVPQRRADGLVALTSGYGALGCECDNEGCRYRERYGHGEPDADGVVTRFITLINVVVNDSTLDEPVTAGSSTGVIAEPGEGCASDTDRVNDGPGYLLGHGPITAQHARDIAARADAKIRPFGEPITDTHADTDALIDFADSAPNPAPPSEPPPSEPEPAASGPAAHIHHSRPELDFAFAWREIVFHFDRQIHSDDDGTDPDGGCGPGCGPQPNPDDGPGPPPSPPVEQPGQPSHQTTAAPLVRASGSTGYRPSADLRRYLTLTHPRCVFPFCTRPAGRCEIDHRREYDHEHPELGGQTTAEELQHLCLPHHQLKTAGEWIDALLPDGRILWTDPDGRRYTVDPSSTILDLFPGLRRVEWTTPAPSPLDAASKPRTPGGRTRLQQEHARRDKLRQEYAAALESEQHQDLTPSDIDDKLAALIGAPLTPRPDSEPPPF